MADNISVFINTDKTHTPDISEGGFPGGSICLTFYPDNDMFAPGTAGLELSFNFGSIYIPALEELADRYDGWYFATDMEKIDLLPHALRDTIREFHMQLMIVHRIRGLSRALIDYLPSVQQAEVIKVFSDMCRNLVFAEPVTAQMPMWPREDPAGWIIVGDEATMHAGPIFRDQQQAHDFVERHPRAGATVHAIHPYKPYEEPDGSERTSGPVAEPGDDGE